MKESVSNSEIVRSLKALGAWAYKIADFPTQKTMSLTRFTVTKPCDIIAGYRGYILPIEGKLIKKRGSFGMKDMRPAQVENLDKLIEAGCDAWVFLNLRVPAGTLFKGSVYPRQDKLLIFAWNQFRKMKNNYTFDMLLTIPGFKKITLDGKRIYDLRPFLAMYEPFLKE